MNSLTLNKVIKYFAERRFEQIEDNTTDNCCISTKAHGVDYNMFRKETALLLKEYIVSSPRSYVVKFSGTGYRIIDSILSTGVNACTVRRWLHKYAGISYKKSISLSPFYG